MSPLHAFSSTCRQKAHVPPFSRPSVRVTLFTGVRKHARKTHLAWLKSVDETAGSRDRHFESKPSTYCVKEEGYSFDDDIEIEEPSASLTPAAPTTSPSL